MSNLLSAVEIAMKREHTRDDNLVPPMIHPLGKHWSQPDPSKFLIDDQSVIMTRAERDALSDYTQSQPSGVYPGKMWRAMYLPRPLEQCPRCGSKHLASVMRGNHVLCKCGGCSTVWCELTVWFLCWFGFGKTPDTCSTHTRRILIA